MSRAVAVLDPAPNRVVGQEVLEAMLLGAPVLVVADGGATRQHAEVGNGGLWYRIEDELIASIRLLLDQDLRSALGEQGRAYAENRFADPDTYVKRVSATILAEPAQTVAGSVRP
jgi:glycosyltransferase involved in cell wall biosynthesis